jgi:hypothetical protein
MVRACAVQGHTGTQAASSVVGLCAGAQVVTKGKAKVPAVLESGSIVELGNFCCAYDQAVPLEEFK